MHRLFPLMALCLSFLPMSANADGNFYTLGDLHLRAGPSAQTQSLAVLRKGKHGELLQCYASGWCAVSYRGQQGYVSQKWINDTTRNHWHDSKGDAHYPKN